MTLTKQLLVATSHFRIHEPIGSCHCKHIWGRQWDLGALEVVEPPTLHMLSPSVMTGLIMMVMVDGDGEDDDNDDVYGDDAGPEH